MIKYAKNIVRIKTTAKCTPPAILLWEVVYVITFLNVRVLQGKQNGEITRSMINSERPFYGMEIVMILKDIREVHLHGGVVEDLISMVEDLQEVQAVGERIPPEEGIMQEIIPGAAIPMEVAGDQAILIPPRATEHRIL